MLSTLLEESSLVNVFDYSQAPRLCPQNLWEEKQSFNVGLDIVTHNHFWFTLASLTSEKHIVPG